MGYDIHITRAEHWMDDDAPITLAEVEAVMDQLPPGFRIDRTGIVTAVSPNGQTLSAEVGPYLVFMNGDDENSRVHIYFNSPHGPYFRVADTEAILPVITLANALKAKVQGDEGEVYTETSI